MLRRLGIQAGAPLFIPGVGALVMLKQHITDPIADARIGLAGPVWGLGAAVAAWLAYLATGAPIWLAIAELTGYLNLFNLIPIWQLDGSRGFHALSRQERWIVLGAIGAALWLTGVGVLWIVGAVAVYRTMRSEAGPGHQPTMVTFAGLVLALSWFARAVGSASASGRARLAQLVTPRTVICSDGTGNSSSPARCRTSLASSSGFDF